MGTRPVRTESGTVFEVDNSMLPPAEEQTSDYRASNAPLRTSEIVPAPPPTPQHTTLQVVAFVAVGLVVAAAVRWAVGQFG